MLSISSTFLLVHHYLKRYLCVQSCSCCKDLNYLILDSCRIINLVYIFVRASKILSFKENFVIFSYYIGHLFWIFCFVNLESLYCKCQRILFFRLFVFNSSIQWIVQTLDFLNIRSKVKWSTSSICNIWSENRFYIVIN